MVRLEKSLSMWADLYESGYTLRGGRKHWIRLLMINWGAREKSAHAEPFPGLNRQLSALTIYRLHRPPALLHWRVRLCVWPHLYRAV